MSIDEHADEYKKKITALEGNIRDMNGQINSLKQDIRKIARDRDTWKANYERLWSEVKDFIWAIQNIPNRLRAFIAEHMPGQKTQSGGVAIIMCYMTLFRENLIKLIQYKKSKSLINPIVKT